MSCSAHKYWRGGGVGAAAGPRCQLTKQIKYYCEYCDRLHSPAPDRPGSYLYRVDIYTVTVDIYTHISVTVDIYTDT